MIEVIYAGHLGNNLFNYALGRYLAEKTGSALQCHQIQAMTKWGDIERRSNIVDRLSDHWSIFEDAPQQLSGRIIERPQLRYIMGEKLSWHGQSLNLDEIIRQASTHRIVLHGYFQRSEYYMPIADKIRRWFRIRPMQLPVAPKQRDVIVHVRRSLDMRLLDRRLDVSYYTGALEMLSPERVYVCGLGIDATLRNELARFNPEYLDLNASQTLCLMTKFNRIIMANSTFSWWGAFLSEAESVIYPVPSRGFMSPDRAEIDLRVPESRYRYFENAPLEPWRFLKAADFELLERGGEKEIVRATSPNIKLSSPELKALVSWIHGTESSFGFFELQQVGFGPTANVKNALNKLVELGLLTVCDLQPGDPPISELLVGGIPFGIG